MKHVRTMTYTPRVAQVNLASIFTAFGEILQVVGTLLVTKEQNNSDPYDWSTTPATDLTDIANLL